MSRPRVARRRLVPYTACHVYKPDFAAFPDPPHNVRLRAVLSVLVLGDIPGVHVHDFETRIRCHRLRDLE